MIYRASGNSRLMQIIRRTREEVLRFRRFRTRDIDLIRRALTEDREIVEALARRDPDEAFRLMYEHIHASTRMIHALIDTGHSMDKVSTPGQGITDN